MSFYYNTTHFCQVNEYPPSKSYLKRAGEKRVARRVEGKRERGRKGKEKEKGKKRNYERYLFFQEVLLESIVNNHQN